jgi:hypothetical protein
MTRKKDFARFGIDADPDDVRATIRRLFDARYKPQLSEDELLFRPTISLAFCNEVRDATGYTKLPDDEVLRALIHTRKNP